jgi:hypothetical protein
MIRVRREVKIKNTIKGRIKKKRFKRADKEEIFFCTPPEKIP